MSREMIGFLWLVGGMSYYVVPAVMVAGLGPQYELMYQGFGEDVPVLTKIAIGIYPGTFGFVVGVAPVMLAWFSSRQALLVESVWFSISVVLGTIYAVWLFVLWYGLYWPLAILRDVVG